METKQTAIYLTDEDALLFCQFQKRYAFMKLLESLNVFNLRSANVVINFNNLGEIMSVDIQQHYKLP
jgi:hypothetical protein